MGEIGMYVKINNNVYTQKKFMKIVRHKQRGTLSKITKDITQNDKDDILRIYDMIMKNKTINKILTGRPVKNIYW